MTEDARKTRHTLAAYRKQLRKLKAQRQLIAALEQGCLGHAPPGVRSSLPGDPTQTTVIRLEKERERLKQLELGVHWRRSLLKCYLDTVEDSVVRMVLYLKYWDGRTWKQIAVRHGVGATEDAMRKIAERYMELHPMPWFRV
jgi:hypothetical protein